MPTREPSILSATGDGLDPRDLVLTSRLPMSPRIAALERKPASGRAAVIELEDGVAAPIQVLRPQIDGHSPGVAHLLHVRSAVDGYDKWQLRSAFLLW